jgi:hypothetical protein
MAKLSREQLTQLLVNAGFKKNSDTLNTMIGIAYAESGGDPNAHNDNPKTGDESYGLWQINMIGKLGPSRRKALGISSNSALFDPATNARAAYMIYKSSGLNAWTTYTRGTYLKYMDTTTSAEDPDGGNVLTDTASKLSDFSGITGAINKVGGDLFKGVSNIAGIAVAIVLLILGVVLLARTQIANVLPTGKVAKVAKGLAK